MKKLITVMTLALCAVVSADSSYYQTGDQYLASEYMLDKCAPSTIVMNSNNMNTTDFAICPKIDACNNKVSITYVKKNTCMNNVDSSCSQNKYCEG